MASASPAITYAEAISMLHLLHQVPVAPSSNPVEPPARPLGKTQHTMPFEVERGLCSTLAFLSSIKGDPNYIPAVCLRENLDQDALDVLVAVNQSIRCDGAHALQSIQAGFVKIFSLLSEMPRGTHRDVEARLFTRIVTQWSERIRFRLHFVRNERGRQTLKQLLQAAIGALSYATLSASHLTAVDSFLQKAQMLMAKIDAWLDHQESAWLLKDMVEGIYRLSRLGHLRKTVDLITNGDMQPSARESLVNMLRKVARYREASRYLCRTAAKFPIATRMRFVPVCLPYDAFRQSSAHHSGRAMASVLERLSIPHEEVRHMPQVWIILGIDERTASKRFDEQMNRAVSGAKVHAEVQLVRYCEAPALAPRPRVICSSKDACFLCNAFIRLHGQFHTPRSHGRLYPGWRLPPFPQPSDLEQRFSLRLQSCFLDSIRTMLSTQKRILYPCPNESTLMALPSLETSTETIFSSTASRVVAAHSPGGDGSNLAASGVKSLMSIPDITASPEATPAAPSPCVSNEAMGGASLSNKSTTSAGWATHGIRGRMSSPEITAPPEPPPAGPSRRTTTTTGTCADRPASQTSTPVPLPQGEALEVVVGANETSAQYEAPPIRMQIEYSVAGGPDASTGRALLCRLEWLRHEDAQAVRQASSAIIVDAERLDGCITVRPCDLGRLYMCARGALLHVCIE